jgi:hypothetical protein
MEGETLQVITSAVAPIVMVSAAGVLSMGVQAKNLHLADRLRTLMDEYRTLPSEPARQQRRDEILAQLALFRRRIALSQHALECNYVAMATFVVTSLLLVAAPWLRGGGAPAVNMGVFVIGVLLLLIALVLEFWEMHLGLRTVDLEIGGAARNR